MLRHRFDLHDQCVLKTMDQVHKFYSNIQYLSELVLLRLLKLLFVLLLFWIFWFLPKYFKSYRIEVSENAIVVKHGVFIETTQLMPFPRLIYAKSHSTPLADRLGLAGVFLRAARGIIIIPELEKADAVYLIQGISGGEKR